MYVPVIKCEAGDSGGGWWVGEKFHADPSKRACSGNLLRKSLCAVRLRSFGAEVGGSVYVCVNVGMDFQWPELLWEI